MGRKGKITRAEEQRRKEGRSRATRAHGVWRLSMETAWGPALDATDDFAFAQTRWKPALLRLADELDSGAKKAFQTGVGPDGYKWAKLKTYYSDVKTRNGFSRAMLVRDGKLRAAAQKKNALKKITNTRMIYEIDSIYATTHQFGSARNLSKGKHGGFRGARVRNFMIWGDDFKDLFASTLNDYARERRDAIFKGLEDNGR